MNTTVRVLVSGLLAGLGNVAVHGQNLPAPLSFSLAGQFRNGVAESSNSVLYTDNDLTNGYLPGIDLHDAPASLVPNGPVGSATFQWGTPSASSAYPHTSALWFEPLSGSNILPEQSFALGYLYYRNGTIRQNTGASAVELALSLHITQPTGVAPFAADYPSALINTINSSDPVSSADIVSLSDVASPLNFWDAHGNRYYLEMTFRVDQTTIDGTLSTEREFRVFEGGQGRAELLGRFTLSPSGYAPPVVPEPSACLLCMAGSCLIWTRRRSRHDHEAEKLAGQGDRQVGGPR